MLPMAITNMKGVSHVVAILLLTIITLAIAGMTYISYTGIADVATKTNDKLPESFKVVSTSERMVYLKNTGPEDMSVPLFFTEDGEVQATRGCEFLKPDEICGYELDLNDGVHEVTIGGESSRKAILYVGVEKPTIDVPTTTIIPPVTSPPRVIPTTTVPGSVTTTTLSLPHRRVFVSSTTYNANLGGLTGGDAKCQTLADASGLGGTWKAWLSDDTTNAIDRIPDAIYTDACRNVLINGKSDFTDRVITSPIRRDENYMLMAEDAIVFTGTRNNGLKHEKSCDEWTSDLTKDNFAYGRTASVSEWSLKAYDDCLRVRHLYCFETVPPATSPSAPAECAASTVTSTTSTTTTTIMPLPDRRVFVTSVAYGTFMGGLSGADNKCTARASAAGLSGAWTAYLSDASTNAKDRIPDGIYYKMLSDGSTIIVANGKVDLTDGTIESSIDMDESRSIISSSAVWTGTDSSGSSVLNGHCNSWTTESTAYSGTTGRSDSSSGFWANYGSVSCGTSLARLYCFEGAPVISTTTPIDVSKTLNLDIDGTTSVTVGRFGMFGDMQLGRATYNVKVSNRGSGDASSIKVFHRLSYGAAFMGGDWRCTEYRTRDGDTFCVAYEHYCRLVEGGAECDLKDGEGNFITLRPGEFATSSITVQAIPIVSEMSDTAYATYDDYVSPSVTQATTIRDDTDFSTAFQASTTRYYIPADGSSSVQITAHSACSSSQPCVMYFSSSDGRLSSGKCEIPGFTSSNAGCSVSLSSSKAGAVKVAAYYDYSDLNPKAVEVSFVEPCAPGKMKTITKPASYDAEVVGGTNIASSGTINIMGADNSGQSHTGLYKFSGIGLPAGSRMLSSVFSLYQSGGCVVSSLTGDSNDKFGISEFISHGQAAPTCEPATAAGTVYVDITDAILSKAASGIDELAFWLESQAVTELVGSGEFSHVDVRASSDFTTGAIEGGNPATVQIEYCEP